MKKIISLMLLLACSICYGQTLIVVPTAAGGATDLLARKFAQFVEVKTKKNFRIENVPGAGGNIGLDKFIQSRPNSLLITSGSWYLSINSGRFSVDDFKPISILAETPLFLVVNKKQNLSCERLKNSNTRVLLGTATLGHTELVGKMIINKYPNIENIPYKATKPATVDLIGNHIDAVIIGSLQDMVDPITALATSANQRINNIPTFAECLGVHVPLMHFLLLANNSSSDQFIKDTEVLVAEFLKDKEIQEYFRENVLYVNSTNSKKLNSEILLQLKQWKDFSR
jgi:hypothetical protein